MCNKCNGKGNYIEIPMPGVYQLTPCECASKDNEFELFQKRLKEFGENLNV